MMAFLRRSLVWGAVLCSKALFGQEPARPVPALLTTTEAVQNLAREDARRGIAVRLQGVVTFSHQPWRILFLEDTTGGIYCDPGELVKLPPSGHQIEIEGLASEGAYLPFVIVRQLRDLGPATWPAGRRVTAAQLAEGAFDADLIRFSGYVADAVLKTNPEPRLDLRLTSRGPDMDVRVFGVRDLRVEDLPGAFVDVNGVFAPNVENHELTQATIWVARPEMFQVITNASDVLRQLVRTPIRSLLTEANSVQAGLVRAYGVVTLAGPDDFWIGDGQAGIDVWAPAGPKVNAGETVDLAGFVRVSGRERTLGLTRLLSRQGGRQVATVPVSAPDLADTNRYGQIVQVVGEFLHRVPDAQGDILVMRDGEQNFEARLRYPAGEEITRLAGGSRLQISGLLRSLPPDRGVKLPPRILVREAAGVRMVTAAPWPVRRTLWVVTSLATALGLGLVALALAHLRLRSSQKSLAAAEGKLQTLNFELETRIKGRTAELEAANEQLAVDIKNRQQTEKALKESEERLRTVVETIQEMVWVAAPGRAQPAYVSPVFEKIWGRPIRDMLEKPDLAMETVHPEDRGRFAESLRLQAAGEQTRTEYRICRPDGTVRWIWDQGFPVKDATGRVISVNGIVSDITERRLLEEQLRQAQKMEAIGTLAGGIAHDFNNILGAILGNVELAIMDVAPSHAATESLVEIKKAGNRAKALVSQILAFSRQQPPQRRVIHLGPVVEEAVSLLRATLPAEVELVSAIQSNAPTVLADATQVHQVLLNLCTNAWHALKDNCGRIEVELARVELDGSQAEALAGLRPGVFACLSVRDSGQGMDAATLPRIFEPFFTTKDPGKGTGLGLPVVHGIVQAHDGGIQVTSQPGEGTLFRLYFPAMGLEPEAVPSPPGAARHGRGQRILYLDDELALVSLATRMLQRLGYEVAGFTSPAEALHAFHARPDQFDVVITDLHMPGVSGFEVAAALHEVRPDLQVILSSGHVTEELVDRARRRNIRHLLSKPNSMQEFSQSIHELLSRQ